MYKIELESIINQVLGVFHRFGLWVKKEEPTPRKVNMKLFYLILFGNFIFFMAAGAATNDDRDEIVFLSAVTIIGIVLTGKLIFILWKKEEILEFIGEICVHTIEDHKVFTRVNIKLKNFVKFAYCFIYMVICSIFFLSGLTAISGGKNLPVNIWLPFDYKSNSLLFWSAFSYFIFETLFASACMLLNILIWYIMVNCAIKFLVLGSQVVKLGEIKAEKIAIKKRKLFETENQNLFHRDLIETIKSHLKLKNTIDEFQSCFSNLFFLQIATGALCICGSVYTLVFTSSDNLVQYGLYLIVLAYSTFDVFVVMYLGNEIELNSDRLSYCLFESNWIDQSMSTKKCIIILTEALKQRQQLVIWKLYPLNLETFMRILNLAYSMFNILQNLT